MELESYALCENEKKVFAYLCAAHGAVEICAIASDCFPELPPVKANSWTRNSLRKLRDRLGLARKVGRGTYEATLVAPPAEVKPTAAPELKVEAPPAPAPIALSGKVYIEDISSIKLLECALYNDCLTVADKNNWPGFGCSECRAFKAADGFQKESDVTSLLALTTASENLEKYGRAGRKRGVKPGTSRKLKAPPPVGADEATSPPQP